MDLTTEFVEYVQDLRDASLLARVDSDTEIAIDLPNVLPEDADLNTAYWVYLT